MLQVDKTVMSSLPAATGSSTRAGLNCWAGLTRVTGLTGLTGCRVPTEERRFRTGACLVTSLIFWELSFKNNSVWAQWCTPLISAFGRPRQEEYCVFKASLKHTGSPYLKSLKRKHQRKALYLGSIKLVLSLSMRLVPASLILGMVVVKSTVLELAVGRSGVGTESGLMEAVT